MQEDIIKPVIGNHLEECNDFPVLAKECREEDDIIAYRRLSGICLQEEDLSRISFEHVIFENCRMIHSSFSGGNFTDTVFRSCELSNCDFSSSCFCRTEIQAVKGIGANFNEARLFHVKIADSNFSYANFNEVKADHFTALQSDFSEAAAVFRDASTGGCLDWKILDAAGKVLKKQRLAPRARLFFTLPTDELSPGNYRLIVETPSGRAERPFTVISGW